MATEHGHVALAGSDYQRKLHDLKHNQVQQRFLVEMAPGRGQFRAIRPIAGSGPYVERMKDGSCRQYRNSFAEDTFFASI